MNLLAWTVTGLLGVFTVRRYLYWFASLLPARPHAPSRTRSIVVLVAARNEAQELPHLLAALERTDYPADRLSFVVVSDGSGDATPDIVTDWAARHPRAQAVILAASHGKGGALQAGLAVAPASDLIVVADADTTPDPDALAHLAGAFDDAATGAACGYPDPGLVHTSMVSRYAALERWAGHLVTLAGKDRLGAQPPAIGAFCCFRATALAEAGGFPSDTLAEDIDISMVLSRQGWKTRWVRQAVAREDVPTDLHDFRLQRLRWSRGLMSSWSKARGVEDLFVVAGYLDRLAFVAGVGLVVLGLAPAWVPIGYTAAPLIIVATALVRAGAPDKLAYLWSIGPMTLADIGVTLESALPRFAKAPLSWRSEGRRKQDSETAP